MTNLDELSEVKAWLDYLQFEEWFSPATITNYKYIVLRFFRFLHVITVTVITKEEIRRFFVYLDQELHYRHESIRTVFKALKSFFKFCKKEKYIPKDFMSYMKAPKKEKSIPMSLTNEEMEAMLEAPSQFLNFRNNFRDYVLIRLLLASGMRVSEVHNFNIEHLNKENHTIFIPKAKGGKQRTVEIDPETCRLILQYIERKRLVPKKEDKKAVFISVLGNRLSIRSIEYMVKKYREKLGIEKQITPHKCRHTTGRLLLEGGMDIRYIQKQFGHDSLNTTQIYTEVTDEARKREYNKAHPFVKKKIQ